MILEIDDNMKHTTYEVGSVAFIWIHQLNSFCKLSFRES